MYSSRDKAWQVAVNFHQDQKYGDMPYIWHLNTVAQSVEGCGGAHIVVAYLHDILEDTSCTEGYLREHFSDEIVDAVVAITKLSRDEDLEIYYQRVMDNDIAHTVKIHDTLCNLTESVKAKQWKRVLKYSGQLAHLAQYR